MKKLTFKTFFLISSVLILACFIFPAPAKASGFGRVEVHSRERLSGSSTKPINVRFRIDSDKNNRYKWVDSSGTCHGCDSESVVNNGRHGSAWTSSTGSDGVAKFGNGDSSGFACGTSRCSSGDAGTCNPFNLTLLGDWSDGSYWEVDFKYQGRIIDRGTLKGRNPTVHITIGNDANTYIVLTFHRAPRTEDSLTATLGAAPDSLNFTEAEKTNGKTYPVQLTATYRHSSQPNHGIKNYQWYFDYNNDSELNGAPSQTTTSNVITHDYAWLNKDSVKVAVKVTCEGGKTYIAKTVINVNAGHFIGCRPLKAEPKEGTVPLTITFTADIYDNLGHPIKEWYWDFDYNGKDFTLDRTTYTNQATFTFEQESIDRVIAVSGSSLEPGLTSRTCPATVSIVAENWSESNQIEIAP